MNRPEKFEAPVSRMRGYQRADGRKGIRNYVAVAYLVECAHHVARHIAQSFEFEGAQLIGFPGCYLSAYADSIMTSICTHPNVGAVLLVSLGCEEFRRSDLLDAIRSSGRREDASIPLVLRHPEERGQRLLSAAGRDEPQG